MIRSCQQFRVLIRRIPLMKTVAVCGLLAALTSAWAAEPAPRIEFRLLATSKTSTMEKEMNEYAQAGYDFRTAMGGETAFGGKEVVIVMGRSTTPGRKTYKLLAASRTSTLEKEMQTAGQQGFEYKGQTVFESAFGGREMAVIMERDDAAPARRITYKLLATSKTSTMQKELAEAGEAGFDLLGTSVGKTAFGGSEVVSILRQTLD
jgi:hypothetical protein